MFHWERICFVCFFYAFLSLRIYSKTKNRQWILSFEAEMQRKKEKKLSKKLKASQSRNLKDFMDSSDEDFY